MKKRLTTLFLVLLLLAPALLIPASADIGPKPSVTICFENPPEKDYYVTLLSQTSSTGPYSAATPRDIRDHEQGADQDIYLKFVEYQDPDGFYFLQFYDPCGETGSFAWTYYPLPRSRFWCTFRNRTPLPSATSVSGRSLTAASLPVWIPCGPPQTEAPLSFFISALTTAS